MYIKEAHPSDGWVMKVNEKEGIEVEDPKSIEEREEVASTCVLKLNLSMTALIDDMKNTAGKAYWAWPDRIFVVDKEGQISFRSGPGPAGFKVADLRKHLEELFENENENSEDRSEDESEQHEGAKEKQE